MKIKRKIIRIDEEKCDGCGLCVLSCAEGAIGIVDGKARLLAEKYCDGLGACLGECPRDALTIVEMEVDNFDAAAAEKHVQSEKSLLFPSAPVMPPGCPSARLQTFSPITDCDGANQPVSRNSPGSALAHWPVQIRLVPPTAPFLKDADLLVAADCTPVAYADFHRDFLAGRVVLVGCPKFDDAEAYVEKFMQIFQKNAVKRVTVLVMEVPCCQGLPMIVRKAMALAGRDFPLQVVVISIQGKILKML